MLFRLFMASRQLDLGSGPINFDEMVGVIFEEC
jgi:hypothetical protein